MRKIKFLDDARSKRRNEDYAKDSTVEMTEDRARFYVSRGVAEYLDGSRQKQSSATDIAKTAATSSQPPAPPTAEAYDQTVTKVMAAEFDLDYAVNGMSTFYKIDAKTVRRELETRIEAAKKAHAAAGAKTEEAPKDDAAKTRTTRRAGAAAAADAKAGTEQDLAPKASARPAADLQQSEGSKDFIKGEDR